MEQQSSLIKELEVLILIKESPTRISAVVCGDLELAQKQLRRTQQLEKQGKLAHWSVLQGNQGLLIQVLVHRGGVQYKKTNTRWLD